MIALHRFYVKCQQDFCVQHGPFLWCSLLVLTGRFIADVTMWRYVDIYCRLESSNILLDVDDLVLLFKQLFKPVTAPASYLKEVSVNMSSIGRAVRKVLPVEPHYVTCTPLVPKMIAHLNKVSPLPVLQCHQHPHKVVVLIEVVTVDA